MRFRLVIVGVIVIAAIATILTYHALTVQKTSGPHSSGLAVSLVGYTNRAKGTRDVILEVRNRGHQSVWLNDFVTVYYFDTTHSGDSHSLSNAGWLPPGAMQSICFPVPTQQLRWRAEIGGVDQLELSVKQKLKETTLF